MTQTFAKRWAGVVVAAALVLITGFAAADRPSGADNPRDLAATFKLAAPLPLPCSATATRSSTRR